MKDKLILIMRSWQGSMTKINMKSHLFYKFLFKCIVSSQYLQLLIAYLPS